jgi:hypothetical protein
MQEPAWEGLILEELERTIQDVTVTQVLTDIVKVDPRASRTR